jgi:hypothetical protein
MKQIGTDSFGNRWVSAASASIRVLFTRPGTGLSGTEAIWPTWPLKALLAVLFLGPLIAPLFQATGLPIIAGSGLLARDVLAYYICPTPAKSYVLLGFPMAVCARCWGATIGLWAAWLLFRPPGAGRRSQVAGCLRFTIYVSRFTSHVSRLLYRPVILSSCHLVILSALRLTNRLLSCYLALPRLLRLALSALPFLLWVAEIDAWPAAPYWVLLLNGAHAGLWAGLFCCSIWPGLEMRVENRVSSGQIDSIVL